MKDRLELTSRAIGVMQSWVNGATIECRVTAGEGPWAHVPSPSWDWNNYNYRVKPEPMEIEVWCKSGLPWALTASHHDESMFKDGFTKKKFREVL